MDLTAAVLPEFLFCLVTCETCCWVNAFFIGKHRSNRDETCLGHLRNGAIASCLDRSRCTAPQVLTWPDVYAWLPRECSRSLLSWKVLTRHKNNLINDFFNHFLTSDRVPLGASLFPSVPFIENSQALGLTVNSNMSFSSAFFRTWNQVCIFFSVSVLNES